MMFVKQRAVQGDQSLPLLIVEFCRRLRLGALRAVDLDAFGLDHDETGIYSFDLGDKLFLADRTCLGLFDHDRDGGVLFLGCLPGAGPATMIVSPRGS